MQQQRPPQTCSGTRCTRTRNHFRRFECLLWLPSLIVVTVTYLCETGASLVLYMPPLHPIATRRTIIATVSAVLTTTFASTKSGSTSNLLVPKDLASIIANHVITGTETNSILSFSGDITWDPALFLKTNLAKSRMLAQGACTCTQPFGVERTQHCQTSREGSFYSPFLQHQQQLFYPSFLFGEWNVTATLKRYQTVVVVSAPLMQPPPPPLVGASDRHTLSAMSTQPLRFYSTLPDTLENQITVQLGLGVPKAQIIADETWNDPIWFSLLLPLTATMMNSNNHSHTAIAESMIRRKAGTMSETSEDGNTFATVEYFTTTDSLDRTAEDMINYELDIEYQNHNRMKTIETKNQAMDLNHHAQGILAVARLRRWDKKKSKQIICDYELQLHPIVTTLVRSGDSSVDILEYKACVHTPKDVVQCY